MYSISGYGSMIADRVRMEAYVEALRRAVRPGAVVLDIGTGTGIFALLACRFGAGRVFAIEPDDALQVAREMAAANGLADRIEFIQDLSTRLTLPERADVILSDLRGVLPFFRHHLPSIIDARRRLLAPGGVLIPCRDTLWAAVVEAPDTYRKLLNVWDERPWEFDPQAARRIVVNTWTKARVRPEQLLVEPQSWAILDYATLDSPDHRAELTWTARRQGTAHGLLVWFDATLAGDLGFSNAPAAPELIYGSAFFPWSQPVPLAEGDTMSVRLQANLVGEDYVWRWDARILNQGHPHEVKAEFRQSTFFGVPLSPARLRRQADRHVPALNEEGQIDQFILNLMDGGRSLGEIARRVAGQFSQRFAGEQDALTRVGELSQRYSR
jgi:protein arginine N-methyltransferase 1